MDVHEEGSRLAGRSAQVRRSLFAAHPARTAVRAFAAVIALGAALLALPAAAVVCA
ncbi:hypothetical protein [Streptomyces sp. NPDC017448]|uniref:hypothetical protein n=1 Tax=Streptomyces sp. NPDC017448 TaxID=3364996 RepID=UPI0037ACF955